MIQKLLLSTRIIWMKLIKLLKNKIQYEKKVLTVFAVMIADMHNNEKLNKVVDELFIRRIKLNISLVFITQLYFKEPKDVSLFTTRFF